MAEFWCKTLFLHVELLNLKFGDLTIYETKNPNGVILTEKDWWGGKNLKKLFLGVILAF